LARGRLAPWPPQGVVAAQRQELVEELMEELVEEGEVVAAISRFHDFTISQS